MNEDHQKNRVEGFLDIINKDAIYVSQILDELEKHGLARRAKMIAAMAANIKKEL